MIRIKDVKRMIEQHENGFTQGNAEDWLQENGISEPAFHYVCKELEATLKNSLLDGEVQSLMAEEDVNPMLLMTCAIQAIVGVSFTVGWELHKEYGSNLAMVKGPPWPDGKP